MNMLSPPPSPPSFRIFRACYLGTLLLLFLAVAALIPGASAASCVDEFEPCATDKNCCGRRNQGQSKVECVMGHANQTIVTVDVDTGTETSTIPTTCKSKRSQAFDTLSYEQEIASHRMQIAFFSRILRVPRPARCKIIRGKETARCLQGSGVFLSDRRRVPKQLCQIGRRPRKRLRYQGQDDDPYFVARFFELAGGHRHQVAVGRKIRRSRNHRTRLRQKRGRLGRRRKRR
mmetsp:Transcript_9754/g.19583  ORF Transcript_9754/g.19583 Transcript_9754/m.19583 type:complete len:232 (-) Transcript_9754:372-1067(-)